MKQKKSSNERAIFKKTGEELQQYLMFKRHGTYVKNKKGKGSYRREKPSLLEI